MSDTSHLAIDLTWNTRILDAIGLLQSGAEESIYEFPNVIKSPTMAPMSFLSNQLTRRDAGPAHAIGTQGQIFLSAASGLFIVAARMKKLSRSVDPVELQLSLVEQVHRFESQLQQRNVRAEQILIAKYFICALLDDVAGFEWLGEFELWRAYSLLHYFFQESGQDDRVLTLIERLQQEPAMNIGLLEFAYMILVYGYQGPYRDSQQSYFKLLGKIDELYHVLNWHYGDFRKSLFVNEARGQA